MLNVFDSLQYTNILGAVLCKKSTFTISNFRATLIHWLVDYLRIAKWFPVISLLSVAATGIAAVLEGLGLAMLIPILNATISTQSISTTRWMRWFPGNQLPSTSTGLAFFLMLVIGASLARAAADVLLLGLRTKVERKARERMGEALLEMSWPAFLGMRLGDISKAQVMEGQQIGLGTQAFLQSAGSTLAALAYLGVAFTMSVEMTAYTLVFCVLGAFMYRCAATWGRRHTSGLSGIVSSIGERTADLFSGLKFIKSTGLLPAAENEAKALFDKWSRAYFRSQTYGISTRLGFEMLGVCFIGTFLFAGVSRGTQGVATTLAFLAIFYRFAPKLLTIQESLFQARTYHSWIRTWQERYESACSTREVSLGNWLPSLKDALIFRQVTFVYPGSDVPTLAEIDLTIVAGQCVAVIGRSGAGKTTLLDLLTGLLQVSKGDIFIDGCAISEIDMRVWRQQIGLVMQDTPIFEGTVIDNIAWGASVVDIERARQCATMAYAIEFIEAFPLGFETPVGERGGRLSGGQKQRLALARALYRQPELLILDEPTSALDNESEASVQAALRQIKGQCTMLLVAHRLTTVQFADRILVLERGRVAEDGTWKDLIANPTSKLRELIEHQQLA